MNKNEHKKFIFCFLQEIQVFKVVVFLNANTHHKQLSSNLCLSSQVFLSVRMRLPFIKRFYKSGEIWLSTVHDQVLEISLIRNCGKDFLNLSKNECFVNIFLRPFLQNLSLFATSLASILKETFSFELVILEKQDELRKKYLPLCLFLSSQSWEKESLGCLKWKENWLKLLCREDSWTNQQRSWYDFFLIVQIESSLKFENLAQINAD